VVSAIRPPPRVGQDASFYHNRSLKCRGRLATATNLYGLGPDEVESSVSSFKVMAEP